MLHIYTRIIKNMQIIVNRFTENTLPSLTFSIYNVIIHKI